MKPDKNTYPHELGYGHADGFFEPYDGKNHNPYEKGSKDFLLYEEGYDLWSDRNLYKFAD